MLLSRRTRRIGLEVTLVLAGILLAFSADRGWERTRTRAEERIALRELHQDFTATRESMQRGARAYNDGVEAGRRLLQLLGAGSPPEDTVRALIPKIFHGDMYPPTLTTLRELQSTGRLGILRNPALRRKLAEIDALLEGPFALAQRIDADLYVSHNASYLATRFSYDVYKGEHDPIRTGVPKPPFSSGIEGLATDRVFWNTVANQMTMSAFRASTMSDVAKMSAEILELTRVAAE